jgi:hypothetical protein
VTSPRVFTMPHTARSVVVLPAPLAPRIVVMPPSSTSKLMPCSTFVQPYWASRSFTSSSAISGHRGAGLVGAQIGADDVGVALHLGRRALGDLAAEVEHHDLVGDLHHQSHVVLDEQDGDVDCARMVLMSVPSTPTSSWLRPPAGSSTSRSRGCPASARASSTRLSVPNGRPAAGLPRHLVELEEVEQRHRLVAYGTLLAVHPRHRSALLRKSLRVLLCRPSSRSAARSAWEQGEVLERAAHPSSAMREADATGSSGRRTARRPGRACRDATGS